MSRIGATLLVEGPARDRLELPVILVRPQADQLILSNRHAFRGDDHELQWPLDRIPAGGSCNVAVDVFLDDADTGESLDLSRRSSSSRLPAGPRPTGRLF